MMSTKPLLQNQLLPDETNETFRSEEPRIDSPRRTINYLRLSVTDRCNLRCMYCMPEEGIDFVSHTEVLSYEEMLCLVRISVGTGIRKVRLTGGEPLVRRGFISFLERLSVIDDLKEITLTTNGVLLKDYAAQIKKCGICRINVSLDSLRPDRFMRITRRDLFQTVWEGIEEAERLDFHPVKINVVAMKGINDDEVLDFARLTLERPLHVRFIEFMPIGEKNIWSTERFISSEEIFNRVGRLGHLEPVEHDSMDGPAERYRLPGARGEVGFISAVSNHFCHRCNRLRLTADGRLRGCLFSDREIDVKTPLRQGKGEGHIAELMRRAVEEKPKGPTRVPSGLRKCIRQMSSIGG